MAERKFGDRTYRCEAMPATKAIELLADLTRIASQGTGRLPAMLLGLEEEAAGIEGGAESAEVAMLAAIGDVLRQNESSYVRELVERIVSSAEVKFPSGYGRVSLDEEFTGRIESILPVARWVLEVNFAGFFAESARAGALTRLRAAFQSGK